MRKYVLICSCILATTLLLALGRKDAVLTQQMLDDAKDIFVVKQDYNLLGQSLVIPEGLSLSFSGGRLDHGELRGTNTKIEVNGQVPVFGLDIKISGIWDIPEVHDGWFAFDDSPDFVSNQIINNILSFSNDSTFCHIYFDEKRTYFFELPYKGRPDLGNTFTVSKVDGQYKRQYSEVYQEQYRDLRIFTIPSNTHLTVNNTIKMLPTNLGAYFIFWEYGKENVTVDGSGTIAGDNDWHIYNAPYAGKSYYGEWGFIFRCFKCKNFTIKDVTLTDAFGDAIIYMGSYLPDDSGSRYASDLLIENVTILRARRNGVAIGARNVVIRNCHFENCGTDQVKGTKPRAGIDFEPDGLNSYPEIGNENVLMENCTFKDNYYDIASYNNNKAGYGKVATVVRNCTFTSTVRLTQSRWLRFEKCYFPALSNTNLSRHLEFVNCEFGELDQETINAPKHYYYTFTDCNFNTAVPKQ